MQTYYVEAFGLSTRWYSDPECTMNHRFSAPAVEWANGDYMWRFHGNPHHIGGPTREYDNGDNSWWLDGQRHRIDGPAIKLTDGRKAWWADGVEMTEAEHALLTAPVQEMTVAQIETTLGKRIKVVK